MQENTDQKKLYLSVRIWTIFTQWLYLPQIQVEPRGRKLHEAVLTLSLKYEDGSDSTHKGNIDKHVKFGEQDEFYIKI